MRVTLLIVLGAFAAGCTTIVSRPDLSEIQKECMPLMVSKWWQSTAGSSNEDGVDHIAFHQVWRADELLSGRQADMESYSLGQCTSMVYLVWGRVSAKWWKLSDEQVLILKNTPAGLSSVFHYSGGHNGRGISVRIVDLGMEEPDYALVIDDDACGNGMSRTGTRIFRWNRASQRFDEVFNCLSTFLPTWNEGIAPGVEPFYYRGQIEFIPSAGTLKDVVVTTDLHRKGNAPLDKNEYRTRETRVSRFRWDHGRYSGKLDVPEIPDIFN